MKNVISTAVALLALSSPAFAEGDADKGAKEFLQKNKKEVISPQVTVNLLDIDTPEEYNNYLNSL